MSIFNPNTGCPIRVFVPGPPGPGIVAVNSFVGPLDLFLNDIQAPLNRNELLYITSAEAALVNPPLPTPSDNGVWLLTLQVVGGHPITVENATNLKLSGQWVGNPDSVIHLSWDGNSRWVEWWRNEI